MSHTATARQCLLGTQSCHVLAVWWHAWLTSSSLLPLQDAYHLVPIDDLPQPSSRSDNHESCFNLKLVCRHREPIPHMCRPCALQFGHVPPVWALSCVTLRVLCACRQPVWQAPNSRLTVTAPLTGWYWRDRIELPSGCGLLAVEEPVSFEIGSGEAARWQDGDCEDCDGGCGRTCGSSGWRQGGAHPHVMWVGDACCGGWAAEGVPGLCCWELGRVWGGRVGRRGRSLRMCCACVVMNTGHGARRWLVARSIGIK